MDRAELSLPNKLHGAQIRRFILAAVGDHELPTRAFASLNHGAGLFDARGHRFLAKDMLPSFRRTDAVVRVHAVRQGDVHGINVRILRDFIIVFVVVNAARWYAIFGSHAFGLVPVTADHGRDPRLVRHLHCRHEMLHRNPAQPHNAVANSPILCNKGNPGKPLRSRTQRHHAAEIPARYFHVNLPDQAESRVSCPLIIRQIFRGFPRWSSGGNASSGKS